MPEFVVMGGSGFIGRALCARLERAGTAVLRAERGRPLPRARGAVCFHLADKNDVQDAAARYDERLREAVELADRVLAAGYGRVVLASSAQVYGDSPGEPRTEDTPLAPASHYGRLKVELERRFSASPHVIARISNAYGPGMSPLNVLSRVLEQLDGDGPVRVRDAAPVRDYIFVGDVAEALDRLGASDATGPFNVSTGAGTSVAELIALATRLAGRPGRKAEVTGPAGPPSSLVLSPEKLARALGWRARTRLQDGLAGLIGRPRAA